MKKKLSPDFIRQKRNLQARIRRYNAKVAKANGSQFLSTRLSHIKSPKQLAVVERALATAKGGGKLGRYKNYTATPREHYEHLAKRLMPQASAAKAKAKAKTLERERALARSKGLNPRFRRKEDVESIPFTADVEGMPISKLRSYVTRLQRSLSGSLRGAFGESLKSSIVKAIANATYKDIDGSDPTGLAEFIENEMSTEDVELLFFESDLNFITIYGEEDFDTNKVLQIMEDIILMSDSGKAWRGSKYQEKFINYIENTAGVNLELNADTIKLINNGYRDK